MRRPWLVGGALCAAVGCGIGIGRDLRQVAPTQVIYDDSCHMQDYYDQISTGRLHPPVVVAAREIERASESQPSGGVTTFGFEEWPQVKELHRVLEENWKNLPEPLMKAPKVQIQVKWAEKAGVRRVVTTEDAQITYGDTTSYLPYHVCLSELLFGAPLYRTRRELLGLPPIAEPVDGGARDAQADATPDVSSGH